MPPVSSRRIRRHAAGGAPPHLRTVRPRGGRRPHRTLQGPATIRRRRFCAPAAMRSSPRCAPSGVSVPLFDPTRMEPSMIAEKVRLRLTGTRPLLCTVRGCRIRSTRSRRGSPSSTGTRPNTEADHKDQTDRVARRTLASQRIAVHPGRGLAIDVQVGRQDEWRGRQGKAGILVDAPALLDYGGPTDMDGLWRALQSAGAGRSGV